MTVTFDADEREPSATRSKWQPVYMGEGIPDRCANCSQIKDRHSREWGVDLYCYESFLRAAHGDR